ncbi:response regulator transcription factor [Nakamurella sp.]|uniref:response regulator transcription factor n=1 Tax=Nakamurella sp. TaxID=1869182 RepID=UPI003B39FE1A
MRIRVAIVDDDALVRTGLAMILGGDPELAVVGQATNGAEAIELVETQRPDVVLMDIRMPVRDGLSATEELAARPDAPRIIVLTTFDTDEMVLRALRIGAAGFLLKDTPPARLVEAVKTVTTGAPTLSPQVTAQVIAAATAPERTAGSAARAQARRRLADLTDREAEVARGVGKGQTNAEIAAELFMSIATVKAHVGRALTKIGADNRVQLALLVHDAGWE